MQLSMTAAVPRTRDYIMLENEEIVIPAILTIDISPSEYRAASLRSFSKY